MKVLAKEKHGSKDWLLARWKDENGKCVFGASDIPALMGASPYKTRAGLFVDKLNEPVEQPSNAVFDRGNILEAPLILNASNKLGVGIFTPNWIYRDGRLSISLDGVDNALNPTVVVEAKTTTRYSVQDSNDLPDEWLWQGWAQQAVLDVPVWFSVLDRDMRLSVVELPDNPVAIDCLITEANIFGQWIDDNTPPMDEINNFSADDISRIFKVQSSSVELPASAIDWLHQLEEARSMAKQAADLESKAKDALAQMLLGNDVGTFNGDQIVSWKQQAGKESFDAVRIKQEHPDLVKQYMKQGNPYRVMRTHRKKAK
jgi:predicted phage-related endonuclease